MSPRTLGPSSIHTAKREFLVRHRFLKKERENTQNGFSALPLSELPPPYICLS